MYITTYVHNDGIGKVYIFDTFQEALDKGYELAESLADREIQESEKNNLENYGELYIANDSSDQYTVCIGMTEN